MSRVPQGAGPGSWPELEGQLVSCMRCGLCQAVCPLFARPGGRPTWPGASWPCLTGLAQESVPNPQEVQDHLSRCCCAGSCAAFPSQRQGPGYFRSARAILAGYWGCPH